MNPGHTRYLARPRVRLSVPIPGVEPGRLAALRFECSVSANFTRRASCYLECPPRGSSPHASRHWVLNPAWLPISPGGQIELVAMLPRDSPAVSTLSCCNLADSNRFPGGYQLADGARFELAIRVTGYRFSKPAQSAILCDPSVRGGLLTATTPGAATKPSPRACTSRPDNEMSWPVRPFTSRTRLSPRTQTCESGAADVRTVSVAGNASRVPNAATPTGLEPATSTVTG